MNPPQPEQGLPRRRRHRHHHLVHLHLDPRHHHHVHIHLCCCRHRYHHGGHLLTPAPPAHFHDNQQQQPAPVLYPDTHPSAVLGQPEPPRAGVREDVEDLDPGPGLLHAEEAEEDEEPVFVLTDEWAEFFAKSEAKRRLAKQQKKKGRK